MISTKRVSTLNLQNALAQQLSKATLTWSVDDYRAALKQLPQILQDNLDSAWGLPENDPQVRGGEFHFVAILSGKAIIAVQPERGEVASRLMPTTTISPACRVTPMSLSISGFASKASMP